MALHRSNSGPSVSFSLTVYARFCIDSQPLHDDDPQRQAISRKGQRQSSHAPRRLPIELLGESHDLLNTRLTFIEVTAISLADHSRLSYLGSMSLPRAVQPSN